MCLLYLISISLQVSTWSIRMYLKISSEVRSGQFTELVRWAMFLFLIFFFRLQSIIIFSSFSIAHFTHIRSFDCPFFRFLASIELIIFLALRYYGWRCWNHCTTLSNIWLGQFRLSNLYIVWWICGLEGHSFGQIPRLLANHFYLQTVDMLSGFKRV